MRLGQIAGLLVALVVAIPIGAQRPVVYRIPVTGTIENGLAPYVARVITMAGEARAAAVILDIDTPGGRIDAAQRIADAVRESRVPVIAWVHPHAWSAGALIALSANQIYISPAGSIGAATPVDGQGTKGSEKIVSAMRAEFRSLAEARGRNPAIAEAMVDESLGVPELITPGKLATLSGVQAIAVGYAEGQAGSMDELLTALELQGADVQVVSPTWAEQVVRFLTNPVVAPLLLSLGMLGLIFEIKAGAFGLGGLLSVASLGLFFGSSLVLGLAGWEEVILLGLGMIALGVEVFVLPGFGVAGILGACFVAGSIVLALLGAAPTTGDVVSSIGVLAASLAITAAVFIAWLRHLPNSERFAGLLHKGSSQQAEGYVSAPLRSELIGREGLALTDLRPSGTVEVDGERVDAVSEGDFVKAGATVTIVSAEGYRHVVRLARNVSQLQA